MYVESDPPRRPCGTSRSARAHPGDGCSRGAKGYCARLKISKARIRVEEDNDKCAFASLEFRTRQARPD